MDAEGVVMRALVLAAGHGTRLGELTRELPKPMLPIGERPLLEHILRRLASAGITEIAVNLHHGAEHIRGHFGGGERWGVRLHYAVETELLGTAGALRNLHGYFAGADVVLVHYGDIFTDEPLADLVAQHLATNADATLLLHRRLTSNSIAVMDATRRLTGFWERPPQDPPGVSGERWVFSGICALDPRVIDAIPATVPSDLPRDVFAPGVGSLALYGFPLRGYRAAIDSPARLEEARAALREGRCQDSLQGSPLVSLEPPTLGGP